jgi:hypothetical protein
LMTADFVECGLQTEIAERRFFQINQQSAISFVNPQSYKSAVTNPKSAFLFPLNG